MSAYKVAASLSRPIRTGELIGWLDTIDMLDCASFLAKCLPTTVARALDDMRALCSCLNTWRTLSTPGAWMVRWLCHSETSSFVSRNRTVLRQLLNLAR